MSAFVLPAELPAHKISCCVYCSLNKSPHLFSTISTRYIPLFHYSVLYPLLCWAFSPYYTLQVHIFLYSTYSLLHTINKNMCLYCIVSFQWVQWTSILSIFFVLSTFIYLVFTQEMFYWELSWNKLSYKPKAKFKVHFVPLISILAPKIMEEWNNQL